MKLRTPSIGRVLHQFWFRPVSTAGFGMMRVAFGLTTFILFLLEAPHVQKYYGPHGILPHELIPDVLRQTNRFSLLDTASEQTVWILYVLLLIALAFVIVGIGTRLALFASVVLLYSFNEYGLITLDGGDTLLRLIGFILLLSPCDRSFTLTNVWRRRRRIAATGKDQPPSARTMSIWPYRLLLWQMILLYVSSSIGKFHGSTWRDGSAVSIAMHHAHFARLPAAFVDHVSFLSPFIGYFTLLMQSAWILLLILPVLSWCGIRHMNTGSLKRALLLAGLFIHTGIFLMMDVGAFSFAVFTAYLGLLIDDDFRAIRSFMNTSRERVSHPKEQVSYLRSIVILYDGRCGFCKAAIFTLSMLDWLHRLEFKNYHDAAVRKTYAPDIPLSVLNDAMHVVLSRGKTVKGFFAFRALTWHLPVLWLLAPFLYLPGVSVVGGGVYGFIAKHRPVL